MVRDVFRLVRFARDPAVVARLKFFFLSHDSLASDNKAKENAPSIIFIDEIDAIATKRFDAQTGGARLQCQAHAQRIARCNASCWSC